MKDFVEFVVKNLVSEPEAVSTTMIDEGNCKVIKVRDKICWQKKDSLQLLFSLALFFVPLWYQELSHFSEAMKNSEIRTVAISLPNFRAIRPTDLF